MINRRTFGCLAGSAAVLPAALVAQTRPVLAAVSYPLAYFAERIAGELAEVVFPVPQGVDPSFWRPGIAEIATFQSADLILLNGAGFADWTARTTLPRSRLVMTSAPFEGAYIATETVTHSHGEGGEHSHTGTASYTWLDLRQAIQQAQTIAAALIRIAPAAEADIADNLATLTRELQALDSDARAIGAGAASIPMIASHPRYQYFARAYGLTMEAVDWDAAAPPSEAQLQDLERLAEATQAAVFIWEAEPDPEARQRIEALGMASVTFPPLANRPAQGDFLSGMRASLERLGQVTA